VLISDFAGRVYPDLGDGRTQTYFADPTLPADKCVGRVQPGKVVKGLMGLEQATEVFGYSDQWRGKLSSSAERTWTRTYHQADLYAIIKVANKSVETDTMAFYGAELEKNGLVLAPASSGEDMETLNNRDPIPLGSTTPLFPVMNGNGNGNDDVEMKAPASSTLGEVRLSL
jgi:hypothetical protein